MQPFLKGSVEYISEPKSHQSWTVGMETGFPTVFPLSFDMVLLLGYIFSYRIMANSWVVGILKLKFLSQYPGLRSTLLLAHCHESTGTFPTLMYPDCLNCHALTEFNKKGPMKCTQYGAPWMHHRVSDLPLFPPISRTNYLAIPSEKKDNLGVPVTD
jgi:hypothetical protein